MSDAAPPPWVRKRLTDLAEIAAITHVDGKRIPPARVL